MPKAKQQMRKPKRPALTDSQRSEHYSEYLDKGWKISDLKYHHDLTDAQARFIIEKGKAGHLQVKTKKRKANVIDSMAKPFDEILNGQIHYAAAQLDGDEKISAIDRIQLLQKLAQTKVTAQKMTIESHLKTADAVLIASIVRRYEPDATDERIIKIYYEELEKWKSSAL